MPIDKSWMQSGRSSEDYFNGVETFLDYAYNRLQPDDAKILCPCVKCSNRYKKVKVEVQQHLLYNGIIKSYTRWYLHGEDENDETDESDNDSDDSGENKKTQSCGVMVKGENHIDSVPWYGVLKDVVELRYTEGNRVVLFNCEWYDIVRKGTGYKIDRYGIISINTTRKLNTKEPFVLANQATQAFYVREIKNKAWSYVVETKPRNVYEMPNVDDEPYQEEEAHGGIQANQNDDEDDEIVG